MMRLFPTVTKFKGHDLSSLDGNQIIELAKSQDDRFQVALAGFISLNVELWAKFSKPFVRRLGGGE